MAPDCADSLCDDVAVMRTTAVLAVREQDRKRFRIAVRRNLKALLSFSANSSHSSSCKRGSKDRWRCLTDQFFFLLDLSEVCLLFSISIMHFKLEQTDLAGFAADHPISVF